MRSSPLTSRLALQVHGAGGRGAEDLRKVAAVRPCICHLDSEPGSALPSIWRNEGEPAEERQRHRHCERRGTAGRKRPYLSSGALAGLLLQQ